jgi:hypothetical protein
VSAGCVRVGGFARGARSQRTAHTRETGYWELEHHEERQCIDFILEAIINTQPLPIQRIFPDHNLQALHYRPSRVTKTTHCKP